MQSPWQPRAGQPTQACADPGRTSRQKGRHQACEGGARGYLMGRCANHSLSPPRDPIAPLGPETPRCSSSRPGWSTASNAQALPTATSEWALVVGCARRGGQREPHHPARVTAGRRTRAGLDRCRDSELDRAGWGSSVDWGEQPSLKEKNYQTLHHLSPQGSPLLGGAPQILCRVHSHKRVVK